MLRLRNRTARKALLGHCERPLVVFGEEVRRRLPLLLETEVIRHEDRRHEERRHAALDHVQDRPVGIPLETSRDLKTPRVRVAVESDAGVQQSLLEKTVQGEGSIDPSPEPPQCVTKAVGSSPSVASDAGIDLC